jgi:hypothetical protein
MKIYSITYFLIFLKKTKIEHSNINITIYLF